MEDQHLRAAEQRGVELEAGVLGRRADQRHRAVLDKGQEAVLLGAVEAVDLVDEQQGSLAHPGRCPGFGEGLLEVGDAREHRADRGEAHAHRVGEQPGDAGLAGARRPPQDHRGQLAGRHHPPDRAFGSGQVLLADHLAERMRAQPVGERRVGRGRVRWSLRQVVGEEVGHG